MKPILIERTQRCIEILFFDCVFLFASPSSSNYNKFAKQRCFTVYLNPWSKQECKKFAEIIKFDNKDEWRWRFNLVGGIPRYLFSSFPEFNELVDQVEKDIPCNVNVLEYMVLYFQQCVFNDWVKHTVFHLYHKYASLSLCYWTYSSLVIKVIMNARFNIGSANEILLLQFPADWMLSRPKNSEISSTESCNCHLLC